MAEEVKVGLRKKPKYYAADKWSWDDFPKELKPTIVMGYIIGGFFLLSLALGIFHFPFGAMMAGNGDIKMEFGWPMTFLSMDSVNPETNPILLTGLLIDTLLYIVVAYILNVIVTFFLIRFDIAFSENKKYSPKLYKIKK